jgi:hypothetical protein
MGKWYGLGGGCSGTDGLIEWARTGNTRTADNNTSETPFAKRRTTDGREGGIDA